ncbi:retinoid-inducible serine carboxypeptidase-like isoform X1 [Helicoverpa zea]|uniref:retinoid-inducible serine carboxypeptidase-like isoform X1 n=2 Tax=Helicoverpa zea TaxID=7113 RepID=UPI001F5A51DC|nr:retinoid-inducible serine carboxypeptidase-like isoform X1 [Helicoverpa zea]
MNLFTLWITTTFCVIVMALIEENPYTKALKMNKQWENIHGYVQVRPGAYMFYWFFYANGTKIDANRKPVIIWIQGGPGFAASGVGNFAEMGPFHMDLTPRNHTWVKGRNVLFLDHPVGTGFSYVTNSSLHAKTDRDMAMDLARAIKVFYRRYKEFRKTPTYLFSQSYGGKLCPRLAYYLHTAIENKSLKLNFKGIGIGGGWVDPRESILVQPKFLYLSGVIDRNLYLSSSRVAKKLAHYIQEEEYFQADIFDDILFRTLNKQGELNFNNVYAPSPYPALDELQDKMNKYIKYTLPEVNATRKWVYLSLPPYNSLKRSFLVPSVSFLEALLNKTKLKIAIYNGNLDVVTPLGGACSWVHKLKWHGAAEFATAKRHHIRGNRNGYYKEMNRLSFWWVFGAGHWIPEENPEAMEHILDYVMAEDVVKPPT